MYFIKNKHDAYAVVIEKEGSYGHTYEDSYPCS